jgi:hypothetical protein
VLEEKGKRKAIINEIKGRSGAFCAWEPDQKLLEGKFIRRLTQINADEENPVSIALSEISASIRG